MVMLTGAETMSKACRLSLSRSRRMASALLRGVRGLSDQRRVTVKMPLPNAERLLDLAKLEPIPRELAKFG